MEASDSSVGSYAWQSILKGRDVSLERCLMESGQWRINWVWLDAWLPYNDHPRILSPTVNGLEEAKVADLIDPGTK